MTIPGMLPLPPPPPPLVQRSMYRGDAYVFPVQVFAPPQNAYPDSPSVPADITSWDMYCSLKYTVVDPDNQAVSQVSKHGGGIVFTLPKSGIALITIPSIATLYFPDAVVVVEYDVKAVDDLGNPTTVERGQLAVWPSVTHIV